MTGFWWLMWQSLQSVKRKRIYESSIGWVMCCYYSVVKETDRLYTHPCPLAVGVRTIQHIYIYIYIGILEQHCSLRGSKTDPIMSHLLADIIRQTTREDSYFSRIRCATVTRMMNLGTSHAPLLFCPDAKVTLYAPNYGGWRCIFDKSQSRWISLVDDACCVIF